MIINGTKNKSPELPTYKLIKAEFLRWVKDNPDKNFNEAYYDLTKSNKIYKFD